VGCIYTQNSTTIYNVTYYIMNYYSMHIIYFLACFYSSAVAYFVFDKKSL